ncbi:hypothetical protein QBC46DRAFT_271600 [Diplogelasinospora grovesii]|uniref:Oxidase ustYa n=1 Tax=Diplogelasinospora grovesii TaxID=303347 RepID=A0AAN6RZD3_9PEZI|nr:hypothetical protein QBC46DRAFT_271600 [Diplogelasinospora grovesii]
MQKSNSATRRWRIVGALLAAALGLSVSMVGVVGLLLYIWRLPRRPELHLAGELNGLVPEFELRPVKFDKDPLATPDHKTEASANATEWNWASYMPAGNGFIPVEDSSRYTLPPPINAHGQDAYSLAVFHQLHCLHTIMTMYNQLADGTPSEGHDHSAPGQGHGHIDHCFCYLRQSILCCGDTALEGQDPNTDTPATDGTGAVHLCKNYDHIIAWAEDRRLTDNKSL